MKLLPTLIFLLIALLTPAANAATPADDFRQGESLYDSGDYLSALKAWGRAAKEGNTEAQYRIGLMFMDGKGMKPNPGDAAYWFRKAAQNGHAAAQFEIAYCFEHGVGVQRDQRIAAEWYWRAAEQGDPDAAFNLAAMYRDGRGMTRDLDKARKYYAIAAKGGLADAQAELDKLPAPQKQVAHHRSSRKSRK